MRHAVSSHILRRSVCLLMLAGAFTLVLSVSARAVVYSFGRHPDKERLVFDFKGRVPEFSVARTGRRELTLSLPQGGLGDPGRAPDLGGSRLVASLGDRGGDVLVTLKSDAFGYVAFALADQGKVVLDVFADPLGVRWKPSGGPAPAPAAPRTQAAPRRAEETPPAPRPATAPETAAATPAPGLPPVVEPEAPATGRAAPAPAVSERPVEEPLAATPPASTVPAAPPASPAPESLAEPPAASPASAMTPAMRPAARPETPAAPVHVERRPYSFRGRVLRPGEKASPEGFEVAEAAPAAPPAAADGTAVSAPAASAPPSAPPAAGGVRMRFSPAAPSAAPEAAPAAAAPAATHSAAPEAGQATQARPASPAPPGGDVVKRLVKNLLQDQGGYTFRGAVPGPDAALDDVRRRLGSAGAPMEGEPEIQPAKTPLPQPEAEQAAGPASAEQGAEPASAEAAAAGEAVEAQPAVNASQAEAEARAQAAKEARLEAMQDMMFAAQTAQGSGDHDTALKELATLLAQPDAPEAMREEAMYTKADVLYSKHKDDLEGNFDEINGAYEAAINFNLDSWRVPAALLRRGVINLKVGNIPEAEAFFRILREKFEGDPNVPLSYYYWGDHYYRLGDFQKAADEFQYLVQVFPDSKFVREASIGLARSLRKLGYDKQAFQIVDYIEKRWPRFYVEFPPFLRLLGDAAYSVEDFEKAKNDYWTYYNIDPDGDEADIILAKLGDIYVRTGKELAARELYDKALADFPDREGGLIAKMRLAEEGIYDEPTVEQMFTVFDRPLNLKPVQIYKEIVDKHRDNPLAPLAQLKLAMWHLWNNKFLDAMSSVEDFEKTFPESKLLDRARGVGVKAFAGIVAPLIGDENYGKIVDLWEEHDFLRDKTRELEPSAKLALALAFSKRGRPGTALEVIMPFMQEEQVPEYSEMAMSLALSIFVENQAWERVLEVATAVSEWELAPQYRRELAYARALALENMGRYKESRPLWEELGRDRELSDDQRAYAIFFLARDALESGDLRKAYEFAQDSYETLVKQNDDQPKIRECLSILLDVTERSGRYREAVKWSELYRKTLPEGDPGIAALDYRVAGLYRRAGDPAQWRKILKRVAEQNEGSLYGRMAASDLEMETIDRETRQFAPQQ